MNLTSIFKNNIIKKLLLLAFFCLLSGSLAFADSTQAKVGKMCFKKKITTLTAGKKFRYQIRHLPKKAKVSYSCNHQAIATIHKKKGILTAKKQGKITVRAKIVTAGKKKTTLKTTVRILGQRKSNPTAAPSKDAQAIPANKTVLPNTSLKVSQQINPWNHSFILYSSRILLNTEVIHSHLTLNKKQENISAEKGKTPSITAKFHSLSDDGKQVTYQIDDADAVKLCPGNGTANGNYLISGSILAGSLSIHYEERLSPNEIRGYVFDTSQAALSNTDVSLYTVVDNSDSSSLYSTTHTDQNGYYSFKEIPDNQYYLVFSKKEYLTATSDSFYVKDSIHCENSFLKSMHCSITCQVTDSSGTPLSDIPVSITKKDASFQWQGCTDKKGLISFANESFNAKKNYTKVRYLTSIQTPELVWDAIPLPEADRQIISDSLSPDEEYILTLSPEASQYESVSFTFSPGDSHSEQILFDMAVEPISILRASDMSIKSDMNETDRSEPATDVSSTNTASLKMQLYQKDGCSIFSAAIPITTTLSCTPEYITDNVNTAFSDSKLRLQDGSYYILLQPTTMSGHPSHAPFVSAITVTDGILSPVSAAFSSGTSTSILLTGNFSTRQEALPCTLYEFVDSQWLPIASLQSTNFEKLTDSCSKAYIYDYPLVTGHTYRLESADAEICFTGNNSFTPKEGTAPSSSLGSTVPSFQITCCLQSNSAWSPNSDTKEHFHPQTSMFCNAAFFHTTTNLKNCVYVYYQDNGILCSIFLANDSDRHLFNDKNRDIAFYDKLQSGKTIKTSQIAYRLSPYSI